MSLTDLIKELRERTGAGLVDCKNALVETNEDIEKAIHILREKGLAKAAKKAGRIASEGLIRIKISDDQKKASIIEVNSETDFVAKNEEFINFVEKLAEILLDKGSQTLEDFLKEDFDGSSVLDALNVMISKIGEKLAIRRIKVFNADNTKYASYLHGGGKIGALIGVRETEEPEVDILAPILKDVAIQVASMSPLFISSDSIDKDYLENEKNILVTQALKEGKPKEIVDKMVEGRLKKELKEKCLLEQEFYKDDELSVAKYLSNESKNLGCEIIITEMIRYEVGEGLEKKEENFAEEVKKQMGE